MCTVTDPGWSPSSNNCELCTSQALWEQLLGLDGPVLFSKESVTLTCSQGLRDKLLSDQHGTTSFYNVTFEPRSNYGKVPYSRTQHVGHSGV